MSRERRFLQCDVFSPIPMKGNGLAVVVDGDGLNAQQMQSFAAWTNLSETTFLLPPTDPVADYQVRIFTPSEELPFAGHPTLGSCAAWLHVGGRPKQLDCVRQQCDVGLIDIDVSGPQLKFLAPPTRQSELTDSRLQEICAALNLSPDVVLNSAILDNGPVWQILELDSADAVLALDAVDAAKLIPAADPDSANLQMLGLFGAHAADQTCALEVRMFAPGLGVGEDPITGSLIAAMAHWLQSQGRLPESMVVAQGTRIGRHGRVTVSRTNAGVYIGGDCHVLIDGSVLL